MRRTAIPFEVQMPRITPQHEQAVRSRIIDAAIEVFGENGYTRASIQDVVRKSGLSVGAVYTHFKSKEQLFLAACACEAQKSSEVLRLRLAELGSLPDRLRAAVDWAVDAAVTGANTKSALAHAMANPDSEELRQLLQELQSEMLGFARQVLRDAVAQDELPLWIDADGVAGAFVSMINGFTIRASSAGPDLPEEARRSSYALLELLLAAPPTEPDSIRRLRAGAAAEAL
jgi:AcrR family transcriptional regulator